MTSSNQDIKTNVATLVCRRGVQGSCFILRCVFLSTLALEKIIRSVMRIRVTFSLSVTQFQTVLELSYNL